LGTFQANLCLPRGTVPADNPSERSIEDVNSMAAPLRPAGRSRLYDEKLELVLRAGARVISRVGYGQATIRQVAAEAGLSLAGLYHYVSSKEELLFQIQHHTFEAILQRLEEQLQGVQDPEQRLRVTVRNHLDHFLEHMDDLKVCARELESLSGAYYEQVRSLRQRYLRIVLQIVESIGEASGRSKIQPRLGTLYLFGMLNWIYMWYAEQETTPGELLADQLVTLFLEGYLPRDRRAAHVAKEDRGHV
jgi:AcrR family transcriptional regulator